jgi:hypothetical protein
MLIQNLNKYHLFSLPYDHFYICVSLFTNMLASESVPQIAKKTIRSTQTFGIKSFYPNVQPLSVINNSAANVSLGGEEHLSPIQQIYVNFEKLKQIQYKNLCKYVDIITGKHGNTIRYHFIHQSQTLTSLSLFKGRVFLVSEHFSLSLREYMTALSSSIASRNWSKVRGRIFNKSMNLN